MRNALFILVVTAVVLALAYWLHAIEGQVLITAGPYAVRVHFAIALLILLAVFLAVELVLWILRKLRSMPHRMRTNRNQRRREQGDAAVTRALVALAAGTGDAARLEVRRARAALGDTPQTLLLAAEAERLAGREAAADEAFHALAQRPASRFLGLRGLLRSAMVRGDWDAAKALAREAEVVQPGAAWLREERAQLALRTQDWREALTLAAPDQPRAALALAAAGQEPDPAKATELERQALQADPGFTPAAVAQARRLREGGSQRRARAVLEEAWARTPNPDLVAPYMEGEADPLMRVKAAEALVKRNPDHPESRLLLARTALEAGLTGRARGTLEGLIQEGKADRRAYVLMAELEQAEHGETPEARAAQSHWLREAATARPEPSWRCTQCGAGYESWAPACRSCEAVGRIAWTQPGVARVPATVERG